MKTSDIGFLIASVCASIMVLGCVGLLVGLIFTLFASGELFPAFALLAMVILSIGLLVGGVMMGYGEEKEKKLHRNKGAYNKSEFSKDFN